MNQTTETILFHFSKDLDMLKTFALEYAGKIRFYTNKIEELIGEAPEFYLECPGAINHLRCLRERANNDFNFITEKIKGLENEIQIMNANLSLKACA